MQTPRHRFSWKARLKSFTYAWDGLRQAFRTEHNTWIHLGFTVAAGVLALLFRVDRLECMALLIVMAFVWMAELFNTALEKTMDFISTEKHPQIKGVKDLAAAAVLVASLAAVLVGALVFLPKIF